VSGVAKFETAQVRATTRPRIDTLAANMLVAFYFNAFYGLSRTVAFNCGRSRRVWHEERNRIAKRCLHFATRES